MRVLKRTDPLIVPRTRTCTRTRAARAPRGSVPNTVKHVPERSLHSSAAAGGSGGGGSYGAAVGDARVHGIGGGGGPSGDAEAVEEGVEVGVVAAAAGRGDRREAEARRMRVRVRRHQGRRPGVRRLRVRRRRRALVRWQQRVVRRRVRDFFPEVSRIRFACCGQRGFIPGARGGRSCTDVGGCLGVCGCGGGSWYLTVRRSRRADRGCLEILGAQARLISRPDMGNGFSCHSYAGCSLL